MQMFCICLIRTAADRDFSLMDAKARISKAGRQACIATVYVAEGQISQKPQRTETPVS